MIVAFAGPADAASMQVAGTLGYLSEWEVTANVTEDVSAGKDEFSGPVIVKHVGVCSPGHPTEMSGRIRYRIAGWMTRTMSGTLSLDGVECGFAARLSKAYEGATSCEQWHGVPISLSVKPASP